MSIISSIDSAQNWEQLKSALKNLESDKKSLSSEENSSLTAEISAKVAQLAGGSDTLTLGSSNTLSALQTYGPTGELSGDAPTVLLSKDQLEKMREHFAETNPQRAKDLESILQNFDSADTDGDGKLSIEEFLACADAQGIEIPPHLSNFQAPVADPLLADPFSNNSNDDAASSLSSSSDLIAQILASYDSSKSE